MKKTMIPVAALVLGVVGFGLRYWQLSSCMDESGLPVYGTAALVLIGFAVGVAVAAAAVCLGGRWPEKDLGQLMSTKGKSRGALQGTAIFYLMAVLGLARLVVDEDFAVTAAVQNVDRVLPMVVMALCAVSAVGAVLMPMSDGYKGFGGAVAPAAMCIGSCAWLAESYHSHANDPVVIGYVWVVLSAVCAVMGWRYMCAAAYSKPRSGRLLFWSVMTVVLSIIALAEGGELYQQSVLLGQIWWFGWMAVLMTE